VLSTSQKRNIMTGTTEGGKKAAANRDPQSLRDAGRKGGQAVSHEQHVKAGQASARSQGHEKLAQHGAEGGKNSHSGRQMEDEEE
jgi:general stress protein YciG